MGAKPRTTPWRVRPVHRAVSLFLVVFGLYLGVTGSLVQLVDLRAILLGAPATDPDMMAMRESIDGTGGYAVIAPADYAAPTFAPGYDFAAALATAQKPIRAAAHGRPLSYVELRMTRDRPIGTALAVGQPISVDARDGSLLANAPAPQPTHGPPASNHLTLKRWHRLWALGDHMLWINMLAGIGLLAMIVTGLILYVQLARARARIRRKGLFWSAGGTWRSWHRGLSLVAAAFLLVVAVTGTLLSIDSFALQIYKDRHRAELVFGQIPPGMVNDYSAPLTDHDLRGMLTTTLNAYRAREGARPVKVVRLRIYAGMLQGVVIAGGAETRQLVFNAATGARASMTEPGYPYTGFPTGWELHELLKRIHRGDVIGVPGRLMDLFAGLSLVFLAASGLWLYLEPIRRRLRARRAG